MRNRQRALQLQTRCIDTVTPLKNSETSQSGHLFFVDVDDSVTVSFPPQPQTTNL